MWLLLKAERTPIYCGEIDQTTVRVSLRVTYMVTPNLSIQYWGQPFGTAGAYSNFKSITQANAAEYHQRHGAASPTLSGDGSTYHVNNNQGLTDYTFNKPDFNFGQFRSNMVVRWEYIPGSTLFLVWTQELNGAFTAPAHRITGRIPLMLPNKPTMSL